MTNQRFVLPDILKGIAVLLMIQVHLTELFAQEAFYNSIAGKVSLFLGGVPAAPLFMILMGFFAGYQTIRVRSNILRGLKLILLGLLLNIGLNMHLFYRIFTGIFTLDPLPYLLGADILFLAGISLIVIALLKKVSNDSTILFLIASIITALMSDILPLYKGDYMLARYSLAFIHSNDWWSYFPLFPWLAYPLIGVAAGIGYRKQTGYILSILKKPFTLMILIMLFLLFFNYGFSISTNLPRYYHHGIAFFGWAIIFIMVTVLSFYHLTNLVGTANFASGYLQWTGKNVTAFYIFQWLLIGNIATSVYKTQSQSTLPLWFSGIVIITSLLVMGWNYRRTIKPHQSQPTQGIDVINN